MATFCNIALTTSFNQDAGQSVLSLDWVLNSGIRTHRSVASGILTLPCVDGAISIQMDLPIVSALPCDLVVGRDWVQYCRESLPETCFFLSSGPLDLRRPHIGNAPLYSSCSSSFFTVPQHIQLRLRPTSLARTLHSPTPMPTSTWNQFIMTKVSLSPSFIFRFADLPFRQSSRLCLR